MAIAVSVGFEDGGPVVCHRAGPADAAQLRATGERLRRAGHAGVVVVRRSQPWEDGWELVTAHAGHGLTPTRVADARRLAAIAGGVAATLADLHDRGIVHGRLRPDRVLVGAAGAVVLCGFGPGPGGAEPADDVAAVGALVEVIADGLEAERGAGPDELRDLRSLARVAQSEPPTRRPSARRLSAELDAVAAVAVGAGAGGARRRTLVAAGAGVLLTLVLFGRAAAGGGPAPAERPVTATSTAPAPEARCVARAGVPVRAAACGHDVVVDAGAVVVDGRRTVVGAAGDVLAVADWGCAGEPRPAVLRPTTGELLVFSTPDVTGARHVERATRVPGGRRLTTVADARGCPGVLVELADGTAVAPDADPAEG